MIPRLSVQSILISLELTAVVSLLIPIGRHSDSLRSSTVRVDKVDVVRGKVAALDVSHRASIERASFGGGLGVGQRGKVVLVAARVARLSVDGQGAFVLHCDLLAVGAGVDEDAGCGCRGGS